MSYKINPVALSGFTNFVIFFDNIRVDQFVKDYTVNLSTQSNIGTATINMIYVPDLDKVVHSKSDFTRVTYGNYKPVTVSECNDGINTTCDDGVEGMTNVRIYVKNIFTNKYLQIFGGDIVAKSVSDSYGEKSLVFQAQDFVGWLNRTVCPIAVPMDQTLTIGDRLKWSGQGINISKVKVVNSANDINFKGKNLSEMWGIIASQAIKSNALFSDPNTVAFWDDAISKVRIMGDISSNLRNKNVLDFMASSSMTQIDSIYVLMNQIVESLMFEFYQDRDEVIRIKPPFWSEDVLQNHVIDPAMILNISESTNYTDLYTRVIAEGGLEEWWPGGASGNTVIGDSNGITNSAITPVVVATSNGIQSNSGSQNIEGNKNLQIPNYESNYPKSSSGSSIGSLVVKIAKAQLGKPYIWGATGPDSFDCSGLVDYCYRQAGYTGFGNVRQTTSTLKQIGVNVSLSQAKPGDVVFFNSGHVGIYTGEGYTIEAPTEGDVVKTRKMQSSYYLIKHITDGTGSLSTSIGNLVGGDLLSPTDLERKYGPKIYQCAQSLIKFSTSQYVDNSSNSYEALSKYANFMLNYLMSAASVASMQTISMPWIRPGVNVWVNPIGQDKVYYVTGITHAGNASGNYTTFNLVMGRKRSDFVSGKCNIGKLHPKKSDNVFVDTLSSGVETLGTPCNYKESLSKAEKFYKVEKDKASEINEAFKNSQYFKYFYEDKKTVERSIKEIQSVLDKRYANAPDIIKKRSNRLASIINNANLKLQELYSSNYTDNPINIKTGSVFEK